MKGRKVLVVDDNVDLCDLLSARLTEEGYDVIEAFDGTEALEFADKDAVDVIILDIRMPEMDGFEVLRRIQRFDNPPLVIVLSADERHHSKIQSLRLGAVDFIQKPFDAEELLARVASGLSLKARIDLARETALLDPLTCIGNRRRFDLLLTSELRRSEREKTSTALIYLDADHFKNFNDKYGHSAGDEMLKTIAECLRRTCRAVDGPCRLGGDEFGVVLAKAGKIEAVQFLERLERNLRGLSSPPGNSDLRVKPEISSGIAVYPEDAQDSETLKRIADENMYRNKRAKAGGKGGVAMATRNARLCLVEDDPDIAEIVGIRLESLGYRVATAETIEKAWRVIDEQPPDLLILDLMLPDGSGLDLLGRIKRDGRLKDIPVIVLTGMGTTTNIEIGFDQGANAYLTKPFEPKQLVDAVDLLLKEAA